MMKKLLKKLTFVAILFLAFATVQAQTPTPLVHLKFENNLDNDGSLGLTFAVEGNQSTGVSVPYSTGTITSFLTGIGSVPGSIEGSYAINFSAIGEEGVDANFPLIQNGGGSYDAQIISNANLGITGNDARTVSAWFRYDDRNNSTNGSHVIVQIGGTPNGATFARNTLQIAGANDRMQLGIGGAGLNYDYDPVVIEDGNWHHVAYTTGGGTELISAIKMYIDGVEVTHDGGGTNGASNVMATTDDKVIIGTRANNQKWFDGGGIDDVRIFDEELSAAEILALYNENVLSTGNFAFGELKAYPNAVEDFLYLETKSNKSLQISVFDITGKNIIRTSGNSVDMRNLNSGLYIVKVIEDNKVANLKILKN
ncbi:putative secreted protein (Por secretion system target) [Jejuia pallidilutea]|uniref:Putative secreted protein (Por secretion system target) n=1 Tax=Jejuia pallidilutea TaxID=504487 RepID=A0A362X8V6_9FLAO|nr:LamG-like jellyroll fold domain-containing protein [Jejuia pallidilutea]PQV50219.1 putative secreted protein (Por secretion system target) [Jejuia pallidilutea]